MSSHKCSPGEIINKNYKLIELLGDGAFCDVWHAHGPKGPVALKMYRPGDRNLKYFTNEVFILKHLKQNGANLKRGIVDYYDYFSHMVVTNNKTYIYPCLVMTLLGKSLGDIIDKKEPIDMPVIIQYMRNILKSLDLIHTAGVVNADLKPDNLLIHGGRPVCIDFNLSTMTDKIFMMRAGTQEYMAPEVILGKKFDTSADIWSAGCIFYELLTGSKLFNLEDSDSCSCSSSCDCSNKSGSYSGESSAQETSSSSYESSSYESELHDMPMINKHLVQMWQILGKPSKQLFSDCTHAAYYYNKKGQLKYNPSVVPFDLKNHLINVFEFTEEVAELSSRFLFDMLNYLPDERLTAKQLMQHSFLRSFPQHNQMSKK